ncbi:MAG TPA: helix-turn-helix domain-containing protein [Candidatus Limnocylindrales bacterium]|jgi:AraC-like DNA-binding protein|nr:helix-turn-helix domain-containing protein [Candidatus Limnocylindrales bacterium]
MQTTLDKPATQNNSFRRASILGSLGATPRIPALDTALPEPKLTPSRPPLKRRGQGDQSLIEALTQSKIYQEYERAFSEATCLPVALRPVESWQLPLHGKRHEAPYCALMSEKSRACASCLQMQERLSAVAAHEPHTMVCPAGLCETAVPVRLGDRVIGYLMTGQVFRKKPTQNQFERTKAMVADWNIAVDSARMKEAYFATRVMSQTQQDSATTLLKIFAQHLSMLSNQVVVQQENAEPPVITKAKEYIRTHQAEELRLGQVAKAVNTSTFYFCKMFKKVAGVNFTDYLSRVRIEKSKELLLNPNLRISEIAYEVGFQSLTHFNRVFKRILGQAPTDYRAKLSGVATL